MAYNKAEKTDSSMKRRAPRRRKKVCVFCGENNGVIDYKNVAMFVQMKSMKVLRNITKQKADIFREQSIFGIQIFSVKTEH